MTPSPRIDYSGDGAPADFHAGVLKTVRALQYERGARRRYTVRALHASGMIPAASAAASAETEIEGKEGLIVLNTRPINAETPPHLLDDAITPNHRMFVRNNGIPPEAVDPDTWTIEIAGESCLRPQSFTIADLRSRFEEVTLQLQLECGGHGRSEVVPAASGHQWTTGAIGCPMFTGVRLRDVLNYCGLAEDAVYLGYYGADTHTSGT